MLRSAPLCAAVLVVTLAACGGGGGESEVTAAASSSSSAATTAAPEDADLQPVDSTEVSVERRELDLRGDGLGAVSFGTEADTAIEELLGALGETADDTGWEVATDLVCSGLQVREVTWGDGLIVEFAGDDSGTPEMVAYTYAVSETMTPVGLTTADGIGLGSTVEKLFDAYDGMELDSAAEGSFGITEDGLRIETSGRKPTDLVMGFRAGPGCGG